MLRKSGKKVITIDILTDRLPVEPAVEQHWLVSGYCEEGLMEIGDGKYRESIYRNPDDLDIKMPSNNEALIQFIAAEPAFKGIGEVTARKLGKHFGSTLTSVLRTRDHKKLREVLTEKATDDLISGCEKYKNLRYAKWLSDQRIPLSVQKKLFKLHGAESINQIRSNPFLLLTFGLSFTECTDIALKRFGISLTDDRRRQAAVEQSLMQHCSAGHTTATSGDLTPGI